MPKELHDLGDVLEELIKRKAGLEGAGGNHSDFCDGAINGYANSIHVIVLAIEGEKKI